MPAGSSWLNSWGDSWATSWGGAAAVVVAPAQPTQAEGAGSAFGKGRRWQHLYRNTLEETKRQLERERKAEQAIERARIAIEIERETRLLREKRDALDAAQRGYAQLIQGLEDVSGAIEQEKQKELARLVEFAASEARKRDDEAAIVAILMVH